MWNKGLMCSQNTASGKVATGKGVKMVVGKPSKPADRLRNLACLEWHRKKQDSVANHTMRERHSHLYL